jgi:hypothetical protein
VLHFVLFDQNLAPLFNVFSVLGMLYQRKIFKNCGLVPRISIVVLLDIHVYDWSEILRSMYFRGTNISGHSLNEMS